MTRERIWEILDTQRPDDQVSHRVHSVILSLIMLNVAAVFAESVPAVGERFGLIFAVFECVSVLAFSFEYIARIGSCTADPRYARPILGRLRFIVSPMAIVDLLAILPFYFTFLDLDLRTLRALRLIRLARIAKIGRYTEASQTLTNVLRAKRAELALTMSLLMILALICASLMYIAEGEVQPDKFPSIPAAMWWSIVTITTIGYGDVYPVTALGRIIAVFTAILGILMIALPTGVFGAAFVEELNKRKAGGAKKCPHCGKDVP